MLKTIVLMFALPLSGEPDLFSRGYAGAPGLCEDESAIEQTKMDFVRAIIKGRPDVLENSSPMDIVTICHEIEHVDPDVQLRKGEKGA